MKGFVTNKRVKHMFCIAVKVQVTFRFSNNDTMSHPMTRTIQLRTNVWKQKNNGKQKDT